MKKVLSILLAIMLIALCVVSCDNNTSTTSLKSIEVTTKPTKLTYTVGESLNTTDMVVTATYSNGTSKVVTGFTADTSVLSTVGTKTVTVSFTQNGVTKTASFDVTVKYTPFTVTFVKNDASAKNLDFESMTVDYGSTYKTLPRIEKDNYTFLGWYDAPSGGNKVTKDTTVTKASNHYLYAQWIENGKFKVVFAIKDDDKNMTTGKLPDEIEGYLTQNIIVPGNIGKDGTDCLVKTGYTFTGWAPKDESYDSGAFITASKERVITLYAQWKANTYTVVFHNNGGTGTMSSQTFTYDQEQKLTANTFTYTNGCYFKGWATSEDGNVVYNDEQNVSNLTATANDKIDLYAKWDLTKGSVDGHTWVQLWENGPKFADFNVGSTISDYSQANKDVSAVTSWSTPTAADKTLIASLYTTANIGGLYSWGATVPNERREGTHDDDHKTGSSDLTGNDDTATKLWGSKWKMPTKANLNKLINKTDNGSAPLTTALTEWTWCDGVAHSTDGDGHMQYVDGCTLAGYKVTGNGDYADNSIFLPAAGYYSSAFFQEGTTGYYWASTSYNSNSGCRLRFYSGYKIVGYSESYCGYPVRAVLAE